ncbi:MAG: synthase subunit gamma [Rhizobacter sp.]|nr:synthase subunit gamma [Rhizobacter sp.]
MSDASAGLRRKIDSAADLQGVVRTMKALAASSIGQYEKAVEAIGDYCLTVELGLGACFRHAAVVESEVDIEGPARVAPSVDLIVFGSDQGLVGRFNESVVDHVLSVVPALPGRRRVWAVGERVRDRLIDSGVALEGVYVVPSNVNGIVGLVSRILQASQATGAPARQLRLFYNRPVANSSFEACDLVVLPLDAAWRRSLAERRWPDGRLPEIIASDRPGSETATLGSLIREYLFVVLYRAVAESLASENAARLAAMERADRNIDDLLESMQGTFNRERQNAIDDELFEIVAGFDALTVA